MTQKQQEARAKFKKAIEEAKRMRDNGSSKKFASLVKDAYSKLFK